MNKTFTYVDLFAGASGLSEGFRVAGFQPVAHVEKDKYACLTIKTRIAYHYCKENNFEDLYKEYYYEKINKDIFYSEIPFYKTEVVINEEISDDRFNLIISRINDAKKQIDVGEIDVIIGGPPCQAYSIRGRKANEYKKKYDQRIYYYKLYARFLREIRPKLFVFENVPGLISFEDGYIFDDLRKTLAEEGYKLDYRILNASDFGVLQDRKRIIIIGWRKELSFSYPEFEKVNYGSNNIVYDLLTDLPSLKHGSNNPPLYYAGTPNSYLRESGIRNGLRKVKLHNTRTHNNIDIEIYKRVIELWNEKQKRLKYSSLPKRLRTHKNIEGFLDRFKVVAGDANYAHTLIAHIAKDGHYYIHPDINQCRSISVREAARIQSFPDNFIFEGPRTSNFTQIGNAVPPLMSKEIGRKIKDILCQKA
ncbi:MAG: DNA cytosine methyltransferase [Ignavibacteriales bacterium]|nr:DNA cytosine methyltransferase [Ignavibacteriales bacterium]